MDDKELIPKIYFYLNSGVGIVNNFRNLGLGVFALYFTLKLTNPLWLIAMVLVSIPVLVIMGYYNVHHLAKTAEKFSIKYGTHYGIQQFQLFESMVKQLKKINRKLNKAMYGKEKVTTEGKTTEDSKIEDNEESK